MRSPPAMWLRSAWSGARGLWVALKLLVKFLVLSWRLRRLPGPSPLFIARPINGFLRMLLEFEKSFPVFHKAQINMYPVVFVYSPDAVQAVLSRKSSHNDKGEIYKTLTPLLGDGLISAKGDKWFEHRKLLTPSFHFWILEHFQEVFKAKTEAYLEELERSPLRHSFADVSPYTRKLTLDIICETAMGVFLEDENKEKDEIITSMNKLEKIGTRRMMKPWLLIDELYTHTQLYKNQEKYKRILHHFTNQLIQKRRARLLEELEQGVTPLAEKKKDIFLDRLILEQLKGRKITDEEIRDEVTTFMFAGHTTTQLALNYAIYLLGLHEEYQEIALREQEDIFGESERPAEMRDLSRMEYLERVIKETLRLYPSVPILARRLTDQLKIGGYTLPKGVDCILSPYVSHRRATDFPDPEVFNPDNFLRERNAKRHPYSYFPFSAGPRNCIGQRFAMQAQKTVLSGVLRRFRIQSEKKKGGVRVLTVTTMVPEGGLPVQLSPRRPAQPD